jgi:hypothetical protein
MQNGTSMLTLLLLVRDLHKLSILSEVSSDICQSRQEDVEIIPLQRPRFLHLLYLPRRQSESSYRFTMYSSGLPKILRYEEIHSFATVRAMRG